MGAFFSAIGNFTNDVLNYTFTAVPHFFFNDVPKLLWALPNLLRDIFNAIVTFIQGIFNSFTTFFKAIFTFIGAIFSLIGGFFKNFKAFLEIFGI
jgi:phage-related protein